MEKKEIGGLLKINNKKTVEKIVSFIKESITGLKREGIILGLSGGIDSALVLKLCTLAVKRNRIKVLLLPERDSNPEHLRDAKNYAEALGVNYSIIKITPLLRKLGVYSLYPPSFLIPKRVVRNFALNKRKRISKEIGEDIYNANLKNNPNKELLKGVSYIRVKHRLRSNILFYYSELNNYLFAGCANKSELLTGFFVKYGDNIADIMPIISLYKTQVFKISKYLGLPERILNKKPSPDLVPGLNDEDLIGMDYERLDIILSSLESGYSNSEILNNKRITSDEIKKVEKIIRDSEYLRKWPIYLEL